MTTITINNVNVNKLANELVAQNVVPKDISSDLIGSEIIAKTATVTFADGTDIDFVQSILDAHDPSPLSKRPTSEERIAMLEDTINFILNL